MMLLFLALAFAQDAAAPPVVGGPPPGSDPWGYLGAALAAGVAAWTAEHVRNRRAAGPDVDLSPLAARGPDGAVILLRRMEAIEDAVHDLALSVAALARAHADGTTSAAHPRRRRTD